MPLSTSVYKVLAIIVAVIAFTGVVMQFDTHIADENDVLEWGQALFLLLACVAHGRRAARLTRGSLSFVIHTGLSLLMYAFLLRELDIDRFGEAMMWTWIERGFRLVEGLAWLAFLIYLAPRLKVVFQRIPLMLAMPVTVLTICGGLFLVAGWPFDKHVFHFMSYDFSQLIEEVLELIASVLLFAGSLANSARADGIPTRS